MQSMVDQVLTIQKIEVKEVSSLLLITQLSPDLATVQRNKEFVLCYCIVSVYG